jgi:hypothetical protein
LDDWVFDFLFTRLLVCLFTSQKKWPDKKPANKQAAGQKGKPRSGRSVRVLMAKFITEEFFF